MQGASSWLIALGLVALAAPIWSQEKPSAGRVSVSALDRGTLVVFPPEIQSGNPTAARLSASIYESIVEQISSIDGLYVIADEELRPYLSFDLPLAGVSILLGARTYIASSLDVRDRDWSLRMYLKDAVFGDCTAENSPPCISGFSATIGPARLEPNSDVPKLPWNLLLGEGVSVIETGLFPDRAPDPEQLHTAAKATVLDASLSDEERLQALGVLAGPRMGSPEGPYSEKGLGRLRGPVAQAAAAIAASSEESRVRVRVWRELTSVDDPFLIRPLLDALANDPHEKVRRAAAVALKYFLADPEVLGALTFSAEHDGSEHVRLAAREAIRTCCDLGS